MKFANEPLKDPVVLRIIKIDGEGNSKDPQGEGSLKGARYRFDYYDNLTWSGDPERSWIFETDTGGEILYAPQYKVEGPDLYLFDGSNYLPLGSLKITEVEPPLGYTLETKEILFTITGNGSNVETVLSNESGSWISATPDGFLVPEKVIRGGVRFKKVDREAGLPVAGAEIAIYSASEQPVLVDGVSYEKDDCVLTLTTKENGKAETSANALPFGTYYAKETKASEGYVRNEEWKLEFRVTEDGKILDLTTGGNLLEEQIVRGDLRFRKVDEDGIPMAKVPFLLIRTDENGEEMESHVLFTDKSGILDTSRNRLGEINSLDDYAQFGIYEGPATEQEECGVWFGDGTPEEGLGALPYGTYKLVELLTDDLYERGMDLLKVEDIRIQSHGTVVELGDLVDHEVRLSTRARSGYGDFFLSNEDDHSLTVTDTIHYENLTPGRRYRIETQFVSKEDPSHVLAEGEVTFVAPLPQDGQTRSMGEVTVETQITEEIRDTAIVAVDTLYGEVGENEVVLAEHRDLGNLAQTLWLPEIFTHAYEPGTHMDEVQASANSTVEDTVMYSGLKPGVSYTVIGVLMDKETGEALTEKGYAITSVLQFTPEEESGSVTLSFPFDSTNLIGKTVVAFESLLYEGRIIAVHADLQDEDQSVHVLQIGTQAKDEKTGTHEAQLSREEVLTDTVQYQGLTPGRLYCLRGTIMVKSTGNPLTKDGLQITGIRWFEANTPDGEVEISFTVDTEEVQGQDLVVFEELYLGEEMQGLIPEDEIPIAVHKDLQDEGQTIHVPVRPPQYVNTGDSSRIQLWACTGILAGELLLAALWLRFRRKKENRRASRDE
ncbi:MAG: VaFE repeat-containing surface-anchored protein [Oscillospiraceae bacterium]|nr:VaFE repeat-containing surface-anchored protein [Oscillospiraceae bacterium]